jgi:uncharacterized membrane protein YgdD (TMEM256/DUF423 family)
VCNPVSGIAGAKLLLILGAINALLCVLLGAFGAHALRARLPDNLLAAWNTGVQYHFYHALGLLLIGLIALQWPQSGLIRASGWVMLAGIVLFSGSLYLMGLTHARWLGAITPFGGIALIAAWALLCIGIARSQIY